MREALDQAAADLLLAGNPNSRRDAELLLLHATGKDRVSLLTQPHDPLTPEQLARYRTFIVRRKAHEPLQYITGNREFYGLLLEVTPAVLIPRPETEHLVEAALERIPPDRPFKIADVGTGSGAIAVALAVERPLALITALDISPGALEVARKNAVQHGIADRMRFVESNLLGAVREEAFDMIVSNPPYIAESDRGMLDAEVRDFEPSVALFAGPSGLEIYRRLIPQAAERLRRGRWLLLEIGAGQESSLRQLLSDWSSVSFVDDLQGIRRIAMAQRF